MKLFNKRYSSMSLKWKILRRLLIALLLLFIFVGVSQHFSMKSYLIRSQVQLLQSKLHSLDEKQSEHGNGNDDNNKLNEIYRKIISKVVDNSTGAAIIDSEGNVIFKQNNISREYNHNVPVLSSEDYKKMMVLAVKPKFYTIIKDNEGYSHAVIWSKFRISGSETILLQLNAPLDPVTRILYRQTLMFILIAITGVFIFMLLSSSIFKHTLAPLYAMTDTVAKIDIGELSLRLPEKTHIKETDKLSSSFNGMLERLETSFENERIVKEKMKKFIGDASHELRTPLTSIHGFIEVLLRGAAKNEQQLERALNSMLTESERLGELVNNLLLLTRLDEDVKYETKKENVKAIVEDIKLQLKVMVKNRELKLDVNEDCFILANRDQIKQVIYNLIHNAVQHTDEYSGTVSLSVRKSSNPSIIEISVKDNGTGIDKKDLDNIFDRFYRIENDRSRKSGGYGLGLSIVKSIVDAHGGTVEVESELGKGTEFKIRFKNVEML